MLTRSKNSDRERDGLTRYDKRNKSRVKNSTSQMNSINMNDLFKNDLLTVDVPVRGETDDYMVRIKFNGLLDVIQRMVAENMDRFNSTIATRALSTCFNQNDVYVHCTCPDGKYRMNYWNTVKAVNSGEPEVRPSNKTNPHDTKGRGCKHVMLVLSNKKWLETLARTITNYYDYMEKHDTKIFKNFIYPAIHGHSMKFMAGVDLNANDVVSVANKEKATSTQFKKGNTQGVRFAPNTPLLGNERDETNDEDGK